MRNRVLLFLRTQAKWPFGKMQVEAKNENAGIKRSVLTAWMPSSNETKRHYLFLEDDLELSSRYFQWAKEAGLKYSGRVMGVSLYRPVWDEINWRSFHVERYVNVIPCEEWVTILGLVCACIGRDPFLRIWVSSMLPQTQRAYDMVSHCPLMNAVMLATLSSCSFHARGERSTLLHPGANFECGSKRGRARVLMSLLHVRTSGKDHGRNCCCALW